MSDTPESPESPDTPALPRDKPAEADRIAKVMARAGVASRRDAERMILEGRVSVNGRKIDSPALDVLPSDRITVDGKKLDDPQETRLWLYYKPIGLVSSDADEKGRQTIFDALPRDLPRVMTVGRLDLTSEGLLLLTNDGELKRRLELPSTGWLRRYRVRVNGTPNDLTFAPLRRGVTIDGEDFAPMEIKLDSQQGANAWLTVGIREGKNREIRRAMAHVGLQVNRLIRIGYGPFKLTGLEKNQVSEVKRRVLRDQLGGLLTGEAGEKDREMRPRGAEGSRQGPRSGAGAGAGEGRRPFRREAEAAGGDERRPFRKPVPGSGRPGGEGGPRRDDSDGRGPRAGFKPGIKADAPRGGGKPWDKADRPRGPRADAGGQGDAPRRRFVKGTEAGTESRPDRPWQKPDGPRSDARPASAGGGGKAHGKPRFRSEDGAEAGRPPYSGGKDRGPAAGKAPRGAKPSGKSGGRPDGRPGAKPGGRPGGPAGGRPAGGAGARFGGKPGGRPGGHGSGRPGGGKPRAPRG